MYFSRIWRNGTEHIFCFTLQKQNFKICTSEYLTSKRAISRLNNQKNFAPHPHFGPFVLAVLAVQTAKPTVKVSPDQPLRPSLTVPGTRSCQHQRPWMTLKGYYALRCYSRRSLRLFIYCDRLLYFDVVFVYNKVF